jgi:probable HAF family extracellular repeat protein
MTDLGTLGGPMSGATGINDAGEIVGGSARSDGTYHAFVWRPGSLIDLGSLPGHAISHAWGINAGGDIAGYSVAPWASRATLWKRR